MEIKNINKIISINELVFFDTKKREVKIENFVVDFPGEYEKSGILLEVKKFKNELFYSFTIEGKNVLIFMNDTFEQNEEILSFFGDVDVLILIGTKKSAKLFENIEARIVIPYGEEKEIFFATLGQGVEPVTNYKTKSELPNEVTEFVYLQEK